MISSGLFMKKTKNNILYLANFLIMNIISRYLQACDINAKRLIDTVGIGAAVNCVTLMFIDSERAERCHQPAGHGERSY